MKIKIKYTIPRITGRKENVCWFQTHTHTHTHTYIYINNQLWLPNVEILVKRKCYQ